MLGDSLMNEKIQEIESIYKKKWIWKLEDGVGLNLIGNPTDKETFLEILEEFSCKRVAGMRILNDLMLYGERKVTVISLIPFKMLLRKLEIVGVNMKIIEPANHSSPKYFKYSANWDNEIEKINLSHLSLDDALKNKTPLERKIFMERLEISRFSQALVFMEEKI